MTTINISLPKSLLDEAKVAAKKRHFASISEFFRDAARKALNQEDPNAISVNGFPNWFEDKVLEAEKDDSEDTLLETEEDVRNYFLYLKKPQKRKS